MLKIGFIDHYDSFSSNLEDWLKQDPCFPIQIDRAFCDDREKLTYFYASAFPLVFSPGPKTPYDVPDSLSLMRNSLGRVPIFGVCLGFQMLGVLAGLELRRAENVRHGVARSLSWSLPAAPGAVRHAIPLSGNCHAAVYNSLGFSAREALNLAPAWKLAAADEFGNTQVLVYSIDSDFSATALGLQFHPESFLSTGVSVLRKWWLSTATAR